MINAALTTGSTAAYEISVRTNSPMGSGGDVAILVAGKLNTTIRYNTTFTMPRNVLQLSHNTWLRRQSHSISG